MRRTLDDLTPEELSELGVFAQIVHFGWHDAETALEIARSEYHRKLYFQQMDIRQWLSDNHDGGMGLGRMRPEERILEILTHLASMTGIPRDTLLEYLIQ